MTARPIILVPGFWLGAWAWDEVADELRSDGHDVVALTLPGLEAADADRSTITYDDHVEAIARAVEAAEAPVVLAAHSGAAGPAYQVTDRWPERIAAVVYVDTGPPIGPLDADFDGNELPPPSVDQLAEEENLDGLTDEHLERFRRRAAPEPAAALTGGPTPTNPARLDVPTTVVCTGFDANAYRAAIDEGRTWLGALGDLHDVTWVDLPTSHWPMWSRPVELAAILSEVARAAD